MSESPCPISATTTVSEVSSEISAEAIEIGTQLVSNLVTQQKEGVMNTTCNAVKNDGTPCTNQGKDNGYCGIASHSAQAEVTDNSTTERNEKMFNHFLREYSVRKLDESGKMKATGEKYVVRIVSTMFGSAEEEVAFNASLSQKAPVSGVFAVNTGNYIPRMLVERAVNRGLDFRLLIFSNEDLANIGDVKSYIGKFNFSWANADYSFFLNIEGFDGWGLAPLGLAVTFSKKTSKRMNEIVRFTGHSMYSADGSDFMFVRHEDLAMVEATVERYTKLIMAEYSTPEGDSPVYYDGINFCTRRFAKAIGFHGTRGNIRITYKMGIIKGDMIVVDDPRQLNGADFVYSTENLKSEIKTDGFVMVTCENHDPYHTATYDIQSTVNNPAAFHAQAMMFDLNKMETEAKDIIHSGAIPKWMELRGATDGLGGLDSSDLLNLAADNRAMHIRWQEYGFDIQSSQNLMFMGLGGAIQMMQRNYDVRLKTYKKTFIPMTNSIRAAVNTVESLENMGGYKIVQSDSLTFIDGIGAVLPGYRFAETFDLHGTWDLDDVAIFRLVRLYSSNPAYLAALVQDGVIDAGFELPATSQESVEAMVVVRSPNGPGEYSIEACNWTDFPFERVEDNIMVIDVASLPMGQPSLLAMVDKNLLPEDSISYGEEFSVEHAVYMVIAQTINPGIGRLANAMMCWVDVMGSNFPPKMTDVFGEMVDAVQQGFNVDQLRTVEAESTLVFDQLLEAMQSDDSLTIDSDLFLTRMPKDFREAVPSSQVIDGRITHFNTMYRHAFLRLSELSGKVTMDLRNKSELAEMMAGLQLGANIYTWCDNYYGIVNQQLREVDNQYKVNNYTDSAFTKIMKQHYRSVGLRFVIDNALALLGEKPPVYTLGMYCICLPNAIDGKFADGRFDRILFQTGTNNTAIADKIAEILKAL